MKEKRWVVFKGEKDPTSIPGRFLWHNSFGANFLGKVSGYDLMEWTIFYALLTLFSLGVLQWSVELNHSYSSTLE